MFRKAALFALPILALGACNENSSRDYIRVVGSSTVYPFTTAVAEAFVNNRPGSKTPVVESTGTGAGAKLFCAGVGPQHPDILDASRALKPGELENCKANGVDGIMEVQVGLDGVALAESNKGPRFQLTKKDIYLALAANPQGKPNAARNWSDVNPSLPAIPIKVLGPPSTSGTRDAFVELILEPGCEEAYPAVEDMGDEAKKEACTRIREDGAYVDKGENDNLIVQNLENDPNAVGIFGYSYMEENQARLHGIPIEGVEPTYEAIASGKYPGSRPLYIYVKKQHLKAVPGLEQFLSDYASMWGPDSALVKRGLIVAPEAVRKQAAQVIQQKTVMDAPKP